MNLDQLTIEIRPRRPWEAVDLGIRMAQRWWWPLTLVFTILSLPVWLALGFISDDFWYYKLLIFWLLLPLFERPLLFFLSKAVFNEVLDVAQVLKETPKLFVKQIILSLTWRRLSPSRSMDAAVILLENLKGSQRASRIATLHREDASPAAWLSFIGHFCVYAIAITLFVLILQFVSHFFETPWWQFIGDKGWLPFLSKWSGKLFFHLLYIGFVLVTPFYVAAGFALYLNRRIRLEAWDVEISFRKMVQKRPTTKQKMKSTIIVSLLLVCFGVSPLLMPAKSFAEEPAVDPIEEVKVGIEEILRGEDFNRKEIDKSWRFPIDFSPKEDKENDGGFDDSFYKIIESLIGGTAKWGELILWVLVLCLIFYLIFRYRHWFSELVPEGSRQRKSRPETLFGLAITEESLPDDVGACALKFWREGNHREALALLYRACLAQLVVKGLELEDGDTELECLGATEANTASLKLKNEALAYFKVLTGHWRKLAYGHIVPQEDEAESLCVNWAPAWHNNSDMEGA